MNYEHLFPTRDEIPLQHRLEPLAAGAYLVDGELRQWAGPTETACGPVFVRTASGLERPPVGQYPLQDLDRTPIASPVAVGRHQQRAIHEVEVDVGRRQALPLVDHRRRHGQLDDGERSPVLVARPGEPPPVVAQHLVVGIVRVVFHAGDDH